MEKRHEKPAVSAASMRTRLEGAAETLEKAVQRYRWAKGLFKEPWRTRAGRHKTALERMKNEEPLIDEAVQKVERTVEREGWGPGCEPALLVQQLRRARAELIAHLDPMLSLTTPLTETGRFSDNFATGRIQWMLDYALSELVPPTLASPLLSARLAPTSAWLAFPALLLGSVAFSVVVSFLLRGSPCLVAFFVVAPVALWRSRSRLEVLPDRLCLRRPMRQPREVRLPKGGIHYEPLSAQLSIAGLGTLTFLSIDDAAAAATYIELFCQPPFDRLGTAPTADRMVLEGNRTTGRTGALLLDDHRAIFIEDGAAAFDTAIGKRGTWASPKGRLLAQALLALPAAERNAVIDQLLASGAAQEVDLKSQVVFSKGALRAGDLKLEVGDRQARQLRGWLGEQKQHGG